MGSRCGGWRARAAVVGITRGCLRYRRSNRQDVNIWTNAVGIMYAGRDEQQRAYTLTPTTARNGP